MKIQRRTIPTAAVTALLVGAALPATASGAAAAVDSAPPVAADEATSPDDPFTLVVIPDTQYSTAAASKNFATQTQWIADHADELNVQFVLHEGDVVDKGCDTAQWQRGRDAMDTLTDAGISYAISPGNHDIIWYGNESSPTVRCLTTKRYDRSGFDRAFPVEVFESMPTFGGNFPAGSGANTWHEFTAGGRRWVVTSLEFGPTTAEVDWAREVAAANADATVLLLTHDLIGPDGELRGGRSVSKAAIPSLPGTLNGQQIWDRLVHPSPNVLFTFNGHVADCAGTEPTCDTPSNPLGVSGRSTAANASGAPVRRLLANFQNLTITGAPRGDTGLLRLLTFHPATGTVVVRTYSPPLDRYLTDGRNQFFLTGTGTGTASRGGALTDAATSPFSTEIEAMYVTGVVTGWADGTYRPRESITREAAAAMIYRSLPDAVSTPDLTCTSHGVSSPFTDVADDHPFCWAIYSLHQQGRINGWGDGTFRPGVTVSRAAFVSFMFGNTVPQTRQQFVDVAVGHPHGSAVQQAVAAGITTGWADGTFRPGSAITREAAAAMLARYYYYVQHAPTGR